MKEVQDLEAETRDFPPQPVKVGLVVTEENKHIVRFDLIISYKSGGVPY